MQKKNPTFFVINANNFILKILKYFFVKLVNNVVLASQKIILIALSAKLAIWEINRINLYVKIAKNVLNFQKLMLIFVETVIFFIIAKFHIFYVIFVKNITQKIFKYFYVNFAKNVILGKKMNIFSVRNQKLVGTETIKISSFVKSVTNGGQDQ